MNLDPREVLLPTVKSRSQVDAWFRGAFCTLRRGASTIARIRIPRSPCRALAPGHRAILDSCRCAADTLGGTEGMFAFGVLIPASQDDAFCVWLPSCLGKTIDTYFSFLKEPPPLMAVKLIQFCPADGEREAHWSTSNEEPIRLDMPDKLYRG